MTEKFETNVKKELLTALSVLLAVALFAMLITPVLTPRRNDFGSTWGRYLKEEENSIDVLFFGSSITYCDVVPPVIWENGGVSSYVMAGSEQTIPISYYYLKECLKTQSPKAVMLEVTGVFFQRYQSYTQLNVGSMPYGLNRLGATLFASEREELAGLLFPPYNYHSRWDQITKEDVKTVLSGYTADELAGYTFLNTATAMTDPQPRGEADDGENYARNIKYLEKIAQICKKRGIKCVFYLAPTYWRLSDEHMEKLTGDVSAIEGTEFLNLSTGETLPELDKETDYYDLLHFNCFGAEKFSARLGGYLTNELGLPPSDADTELWQHRAEYFHGLKNAP